jgi:hypothetical protein
LLALAGTSATAAVDLSKFPTPRPPSQATGMRLVARGQQIRWPTPVTCGARTRAGASHARVPADRGRRAASAGLRAPREHNLDAVSYTDMDGQQRTWPRR